MHSPLLRLPARILEHPLEAAIAAALLVALLFVSSADPKADSVAPVSARQISARM